MNKKITLFTLDHCKHCKKIKELFDQEKIIFKGTSCEDDSDACDEIEKLLSVYNYPICRIDFDNGEKYFMFLAQNDYEKMKFEKISKNVYAKGFAEEQSMIEYIKNL